MDIVERFINYAKIDTKSDPYSETKPSTMKQFDLAKVLLEELKSLGIEDACVDEKCFVYGHLESNTETSAPTVGFIAHMDTAPDYSGTGVRPRIIENYDGGDIELGDGVVTKVSDFPAMKELKGKTLIVTDGSTLLGGDDKAGIAAIMDTLQYYREHPEVRHGRIAVAFTPDEEIGTGIHGFDIERFDAKFAYTMDGGQVWMYCDETFNAASALVEIRGFSIHPGTAKDKMINASNVGIAFHNMFPGYMRPEHTEGRDGFIHLTRFEGSTDKAVMEYIIRDHDAGKLEEKIALMQKAEAYINAQYGEGTCTLTITPQYRNMKEIVDLYPEVSRYAMDSIRELGYEPGIEAARGGTDGAQLCFRGLPCPNLGTGDRNAHGRYEYVVVEELRQSAELIRSIIGKVLKEA
ncbi:MAG: peptidase T [Solobacterium sp.]|nr:peptidase T [Solobacterium sp.]